jgi:hypothetical protein
MQETRNASASSEIDVEGDITQMSCTHADLTEPCCHWPTTSQQDSSGQNQVVTQPKNDPTQCSLQILFEKYRGNRQLMRKWLRWKDNMKMDFREMGLEDVKWIELAHFRVDFCDQGDGLLDSITIDNFFNKLICDNCLQKALYHGVRWNCVSLLPI